MSNKKGISASRLDSNHEIVGILQAVQEEDNCCKLHFTYSKDIELPPAVIPEKKLASLVGKRVGIFNYNGTYKIRVIHD